MNSDLDESTDAATGKRQRRTRLQPAMRKARIAHAAANVFARMGFAATGFREVAKASNTSEALVYRYFPTKLALWDAAIETVRNNAASQFILQGEPGKPSTARIVELTVELALRFLSEAEAMQPRNRETLNRMLLRSLSEDASFARYMFGTLDTGLSQHFQECLQAARSSGDMEPSEGSDTHLAKIFFNLFFLASSLQMHELVARGRDDPRAVILDLVEFQLRGIGLRPQIVAREMMRIRGLTFDPVEQSDISSNDARLPDRDD